MAAVFMEVSKLINTDFEMVLMLILLISSSIIILTVSRFYNLICFYFGQMVLSRAPSFAV